MRIVVTGAGGGLGRAFLDVVSGGGTEHEVHAFTHAELDIGDPQAVRRTIPPLEPELLLNAAAFTDVDGCERDPQRAIRDNADGPRSLALAADEVGAVMLHLSTDYVFDGEKGAPYDERDEPAPQSVYARSKLEGENRVRETTELHLIVRTGLVFGAGDDYASSSLGRLAKGKEAGGLVDRWGTPTYVRHLAARLLPLVASDELGTFHLGGPERATWFDVFTRAKALGNLPGTVAAQRFDDLPLIATRPRDSSLTSVRLPELPIEPMPPLDVAIREHLASL